MPNASLPADHFSARWERLYTFDGTCQRFHTNSDDGIRVLVDGSKVLDDWSDHGARDTYATSCPSAGMHTVEVEYYENGGDASATFDYAPAPSAAPATTPPTYYERVWADHPVAYWRLGETAGATAYDRTGVANGTLLNGPAVGA